MKSHVIALPAFIGAALLSFMCAVFLQFGSAYAADGIVTAATAADTGTVPAELAKVMARYPQAQTVFEAEDYNFTDQLSAAGALATAAEPVIVHVTGNIAAANVGIPENVLVVNEKDTKYTYSGTSTGGNSAILKLGGSVFGGTFNAGNAYCSVYANGTKASGVNGYIEDVTITGGKQYGIQVVHQASGIRISNCSISNTGDCSIEIINGATVALIEGCTITNSGESGIDLIHANATMIKNNTIKGSSSHGISTDTEHAGICPSQKTCKIGTIQGNKISKSGHHGIWVEAKCTVKSVKNNKIFNNKEAGLIVGKNGTVSNAAGNTIYNNKKNVTVSGKKAYLKLGKGNKIYSSKQNGISISAGGKVIIAGEGNAIYKNAINGINVVNSGSVLKITGKKTQVRNNGNNGISFNKKARGVVKLVKFKANKSKALYVGPGCKCTIKKTNASTKYGSANWICFG